MVTRRKASPNRQRETPLADRLTSADIRSLVFADNGDAQRWFARFFSGEVKKTLADLTAVLNAYRALAVSVAENEREATVLLFIHSAVNSVLTSLHFFVSGFPAPAGQLMRHFAESLAMAMMCADRSCGVYEVYDSDRRRYPVHKSLDLVTRQEIGKALQKSLKLDRAGYAKFANVMKFYDLHSHASALTLGFSMMFTEEGGLVIGSHVDPKKRVQYKQELKRYQLACRTLLQLIKRLETILPKRTPSADSP